MKKSFKALLAAGLLCFGVAVLLSAEEVEKPEQEKSGKKLRAMRKKGKCVKDRRRYIMRRLSLIVDKEQSFVRKNSEEDILTGFVTYSVPLSEGKRVAYVFLVWGDLKNTIKKCSSKYYSNWDGSVRVDVGSVRTVKEFAFDDGDDKKDGQKKQELEAKYEKWKAEAVERLNREYAEKKEKAKKIRKSKKRKEVLEQIEKKYQERLADIEKRKEKIENAGEPREGSGRDKLTTQPDVPTEVTWKAGVVGATDGLLIRIDTEFEETTGTIKVGKYEIPFNIKPFNGDMEKLKGKLEERKERRQERKQKRQKQAE